MSSSRKPNQRSQGSDTVTKGDPPVWSQKVWTGSGAVEVAVFSKLVKTDGGEFQAFSVSAKRVFKDGDEYKAVTGFRAEDVPPLIQLLSNAYAWIVNEQN